MCHSSEFASGYNKSNISYEQEKSYIAVFGMSTLTTLPGFYLFKVKNRNTKNTRARCETYLKLKVRTPVRRQ